MNKPIIRLIAAIGKTTRALGKNGDLIWHFSDDLKRFKRLTKGHPVIMGRKTFESIGKPLPDRTNIIITKNPSFAVTGCIIVHSLDDALTEARKLADDIFIIGGGEIYKEAIGKANMLHLTLVEDETPGDTHFPDWQMFNKVVSEEKRVDEKTGIAFTWLDVEK